MVEHDQRTILTIDTSTAVLCIALLRGEQLLAEINEQVGRRHSDRLLPAIEQLLASQHMTMQHIDGIAVGHGPGSYTGVRIGVTTAKTLAWTLGMPLVTVSSLEALAYKVVTHHGQQLDQQQQMTKGATWIVPAIDARRQRVYTALYEVNEQQWSSLIADRVQAFDRWQAQLQQFYTAAAVKPERMIVIGELESYRSTLDAIVAAKANDIEVLYESMHAETLGRLAQKKWASSLVDEVHSTVPNYAQLTEAEANLAAKQHE